ncbi:protein phosphatase regulator [Pleosporales sp. CAS-2024a]
MAQVLSSRPDGAPFHGPMRSPSSSSLFADGYALRRNEHSLPDLRLHSPASSRTSSLRSTPSSTLSLDTRSDESSSDDDALSFPAYDAAPPCPKPRASFRIDSAHLAPSSAARRRSPSPSPAPAHAPAPSPPDARPTDTPLATPDPLPMSEDDTAVRKEPSHHVDYLSYDWREEDIWSSWRHIVEHRSIYGERSRLENASWRTWAKSHFKLTTVSPDTLNWLKDVDVTWLYGPMQPASNRFSSQQNSEPTSRLSKTNSFVHGVRKPILKKRSMSEAMLQKSLSSSSLVKQAAESIQAQQTTGVTLELRKPRPIIGHVTPDLPTFSAMSRETFWEPTDYFSSKSTSGLHTPSESEKRHIRFDDKVEQCIALECKEGDDDEEDFNRNPWARDDDDSSSDEGVVMMKRSRRRKPLSRTNSKTSISTVDNKTIAKLPSTTLKYRTDSPDVTAQSQSHSLYWNSSRLSPSPSSETLKPSDPSRNFLLAEDDDDDEEQVDDYGIDRSSTPTVSNPHPDREEAGGLRRTASGMFMPFEENDEETPPPGFIGKIVDTVNTARDIATVVWNAGWGP